MKLWLISQDENNGWDTHDSMVVAAENEHSAREIKPYDTQPWDYLYSTWCSSIDKVAVKYLGEAKKGTLAGIILASFNAG